jgi:hypothetical protein
MASMIKGPLKVRQIVSLRRCDVRVRVSHSPFASQEDPAEVEAAKKAAEEKALKAAQGGGAGMIMAIIAVLVAVFFMMNKKD